MYNRYIPQSDGSYSRKSVQNQNPTSPKQRSQPQPVQKPAPPPPEPKPPGCKPESPGIHSFLRQILPKEFDTGDLLIVLLLLLMAGDCQEEKNNALLTLALYFVM